MESDSIPEEWYNQGQEKGVFECDKCSTKYPLIEDRMIVGICGDCYGN